MSRSCKFRIAALLGGFFLLLPISRAQILYGLKAGPAYSHIEILDSGEQFFGELIDLKEPVIGYLFEFAAGGSITNWLEFRSGINLSLKGEKEWMEDFSFQPDLYFQYVGIPFYASWQVCKGWSVRAGGHFDFALTRQNLQFSSSNAGLDFAAVLGTGIHIGERLELECRYLHGMIDLYHWEVTDFQGQVSGKRAWRNRSLQLSVGWIFKK